MWIFLVSVCVCISLVMSLLFCVCWKNKTPNNEWLGVDGMVTQKNPDENVNHLPSPSPCMNGMTNGEAIDKRNTTTNSRRSLPDIPSEMAAGVTWDANGDNSSEHYATLGHYQNPAEKALAANGPEVRVSISQHSSISQADDTFSPYERVKYDKIKSKEHPYAQVQHTIRSAVYEEGHTSSEERVTLLRTDVASTSAANPTTPVRSRRSSAQSGEPGDIPAATAVAGGIAASYELPYMTPPINFSGDSQDSSKGYTSISVREPLANILAQTNAVTVQKRKLDVHYSTVSDDSDDVYTTIPDPNNPIYTSESETYARIPPLPITVEAEINVVATDRSSEREEEVDQLYEAPHQPSTSNVDGLKHVASHTHTHSRQASSSSSSANFGSPKPEKRQANSPLPPPPIETSNVDFSADKLQVKRNLDDLYAKVQKNRKEDVTEDGLSDRGSLNGSIRGSVVVSQVIPEVVTEHNYETLKKSSTANSDFGYERIKGGLDCEPGYASINGPDSLATSSDPGYEALHQTHLEAGPNYEELRHTATDESNAGYSVVNKKKKNTHQLSDPNYERVLDNPTDPAYAATKSSGSESDPNYESVKESDPNYESVKDLEPFYEDKEEDSSRTNSDAIGYEKIKCNVSENSNSASRTTYSEPPYERLRNDVDSDVPGYDKVGSSGSGSSGNVEAIQNEENDIALNLHDEDAVVQV